MKRASIKLPWNSVTYRFSVVVWISPDICVLWLVLLQADKVDEFYSQTDSLCPDKQVAVFTVKAATE